MILDEQSLSKAIDKKNFPFVLAGILLATAIVVISIMSLLHTEDDTLWMIGGTELLIYVIANAICSLIVKKIERFIKRTFIAYALHFVLLCGFLLLITGLQFSSKEVVVPVYSALVICFSLSIAIILLIRQVLSMLKDE